MNNSATGGSLAGRTALITGSTGGIGLAIARSLSQAGSNIILNGLEAAASGTGIAEQLAAETGGKVIYDPTDITDIAAIERMVARALKQTGPIDILVNNAVVRYFAPIEHFKVDDWNHALAVNISGAFHCIRHVLPGMRDRGWGRIINMSSTFGARGAENRIDYVTTKTALLGMTRAVAVETARTGVTCNAIAPGVVPTPSLVARIHATGAADGLEPAEAEHRYLAARHPTERFVEAGNVGALALFLCSPAGADVTGATLPIDGGWQAR